MAGVAMTRFSRKMSATMPHHPKPCRKLRADWPRLLRGALTPEEFHDIRNALRNHATTGEFGGALAERESAAEVLKQVNAIVRRHTLDVLRSLSETFDRDDSCPDDHAVGVSTGFYYAKGYVDEQIKGLCE
jgi:hypothetical protein